MHIAEPKTLNLMSNIGKICFYVSAFFAQNLFRAFSGHVHELNKILQLMEIWQESFEHFNAISVALSDAIRVYHAPQTKSPNTFNDNTIQTESPYLQSANILNNVLINAQECLVPAVRDVFTAKCVKPVLSILATVQPVQDELQQRKSLLLDFDSYRVKLEKEVQAGRDSSHPQVVKKAAKLDDSAKKLHQVQSSICHTFLEFESARYHALGPELASFLGCLHSYSAYLHSSLSDILPMLPQSASTIAAVDSRRFNILSRSPLDIQRVDVNVIGRRVSVEPVYARTSYEGGRTGGYGQLMIEQPEDVSEQQQCPSGYTSVANSIIMSRPVSGIPTTDNPVTADSNGNPSELSFDDDIPIEIDVAVNTVAIDSLSSSSKVSAPPPKPPKPPRPTKNDALDTPGVESPVTPRLEENVSSIANMANDTAEDVVLPANDAERQGHAREDIFPANDNVEDTIHIETHDPALS